MTMEEQDFVRGTPGRPTSQTKVEHALKLLQNRKRKRNSEENITYQSIASEVGVFSSATSWRWEHLNMTPEARGEHMAKRVSNKLLSQENEMIVSGWLVNRHLTYQSTTVKDLQYFLSMVWGFDAKKSWVSKFLKRNHLSMRTVGRATRAELNSEEQQKAVEFLSSLRALNKEDSQILCVDKTALYCNPISLKEIAPKGRYHFNVFE